MASWDNVSLPAAPRDYSAPLIDFGIIGSLGDTFYKGRQNQFQQQQNQRTQALQAPINESDPTKVVSELLRRGGTEYAEKLLPFLQQQQAGQPSPLFGGQPPQGSPAMPPAETQMPAQASGPQGGPASPPPITGAPVQPAPPAGDQSGSIADIVGARLPENSQKTGVLIDNIAKRIGVNSNTTLNPQQSADATKLLDAYAQRNGITAPTASGPPTAAAPAVDTSNVVLPDGFTDPRKAVVALRREAARLSSNPYSKEQGKELLDWATRIEDATFGEAKRKTAFEEGLKNREFSLKELAPVKIGEGLSGDIYAVKDPKAPSGFRILDARALRDAQQAAPAPSEPGAAPAGGTTPAPAATPTRAAGGISAKDLELDAKAGRNMEYLRTLAPDEQQLIRKVANYEVNPQSLSIKGGHRERILTAAANYDNSYDQKNYAAFADGLKRFGASKQGDSVKAFNVGIEHIEQLVELGKELHNTTTPKFNELKNWFEKNIGGAAPTNFEGLKTIVGAEIVKAIVGAGGGVEERAAAARTVSGASSIAQLEGIAKTYAKAMGAQLGGLQRQYEQSTGRKDFDRLLSPQAIRARDSHNAAPSGAAGGGATAAPPTKVSTKAEYDGLTKGQSYIATDDPTGAVRTKQ